VDLLPPLHAALAELRRSRGRVKSADYVFATSESGRPSKNNVRARVFNAAVTRASERLEEADLVPLPAGLTPHKLRHTFASLLFAIGEDPVHVMTQLGHTDPAFSLRIYAHAMRREPNEKEALQALLQSDYCAGLA
jgi:integrase